MTRITLLRTLALWPALASGPAALAHEGHGLKGSAHWHASDAFGFAIILALVIAAVLWRGRK